jgi:hypothetical protein
MTDTNKGPSSGGQQGYTDEVRQRAIEAYDSARDSAYSAGRKATDAIEDSPLVALGAGIAAGALIAALLPTSRRERELLSPYGTRVTGAARDAADAARKVGSEKLQELGLMPDDLLDKAGETVKTSAQAAVGTFRDDVAGNQSGSAGGAKPRKSGSGTASSTRSR